MPTPLVHIALIGWMPVVLVLFSLLPSRRAVIVGLIGAWLFLPVDGYEFQGFPEYDKTTATSGVVFIATLIFDHQRFLRFRPKWIDAFPLVFVLSAFASSLSNGLGPYDAVSGVNLRLLRWGLPYFIGRLYFTDLRALRELVIGVFIGGLLYVPFCLYELRMSPQLHNIFYGFHPNQFIQHLRYGGYRPMVFMSHGLMVALWMTAASLCGLWLWMTGALKKLLGVPLVWLVPPLIVTTILCKSIGAVALLAIGVGALSVIKYGRTAAPLLALVALCVGYIAIRSAGLWGGGEAVAVAESMFGADRASSLATRMYNEDMLAAKALRRPLFGWGRWGRSRVTGESGEDVSITDGMWIIIFGQDGLLGLLSFLAAMLLPPALLRFRIPPPQWSQPQAAPAVVGALMVTLWMIDNILNSMGNHVFLLLAGGLSGFVMTPKRPKTRAQTVVREQVEETPPPQMRVYSP